METTLVVLRPKHHGTVSQDFRPQGYDILLTDLKYTNQDKTRTMKQLPRTAVSFEQDPVDALFTYLYNVTGSELGGLKGKRAVFVPPTRTEAAGDSDSFVKGTLYCMPIDSRDKLNPNIVDNLPLSPGFYSLDLVLGSLNTRSLSYAKQTRVLLFRLESWLQEKHKVPGAIDLLFSVCTEDRLKRSITNPAFFSDRHSVPSTSQMGELYTRSIANEALAKMMAIEKCDITIINPLFGSDLTYKTKVDAVSVNKHWGLGRPDYARVSIPPTLRNRLRGNSSASWVDEFPVHKYALDGDAQRIREMIDQRLPVTRRDKDSWAPVHYAAWFGHLEVISVLLNEGECSPNMTNDNGSTPLHLAASKGRFYVIELLLNHPEVDVGALDNHNKTALDMCMNIDKSDWRDCKQLLQSALSRPAPKIQVFLMDGTSRELDLLSGANTTIQQLYEQMLRKLELPENCAHLFTIWICSRNLQLQLKPDHKPIQHLNDWKRKIVGMLTDQDPSREDPQLFWRRDAILSLAEEKTVRNPVAISLLFHEAYHNYIKSLYPCADKDAIVLAGILLQINQGDYDTRQAKSYFANERCLQSLVPVAKLRLRNVNWASKMQLQYKHYSQTMAKRDRSVNMLQSHFLIICWNLTVYGSAFFTGYVQIKTKSPTTVYVGVNDIGVHIINAQSKAMLHSFGYKDIEWQPKNEQSVLDLKMKGSTKGALSIYTKQAGLISHLMSKMAQLTGPH